MNIRIFFRLIACRIATLKAKALYRLNGTKEIYKKNRIYIDYPYNTAKRQIADISIPRDASGEKGLIVFIHGGGWSMGNKKECRTLLTDWNRNGYVTAAINYRFVNEKTGASEMLDDITDALETIKKVAAGNGVTLKKCLLAGASAGAHLCMLYAYSRREEAPVEPACVVEYCGPCDFSKRDFMLNRWLIKANSFCCGFAYNEENFDEGMANYRAVSPLTYIDTAVPTVIAHGVDDDIVPYSQAEILDKALTDRGIAHEFITYKSGHGVTADKVSFAKTDVIFEQYASEYLS